MRDKFIKELMNQPSQNFGNNGTKINIHFPLRGDISHYCIDINREIQKITKSGIDFAPSSFHVPHLTLYMGFIKNEDHYKRVLDSVHGFVLNMAPFEIIPTKAYVKEPKRNYIFIDTEQSQKIIEIKQRLKERVLQWIEPLSWDVVNETPHITVGYIKDNFETVEEMLEEYQIGPAWWADCIEVSYGGAWGSCLGSIRTFEFTDENSLD